MTVCVFLTDVLALASALSCLTSGIRDARTALWCALQTASRDLPSRCIDVAKTVANRRVDLKTEQSKSPTPAWEFPVVRSEVPQFCAIQSEYLSSTFFDEYDNDEVFTDTEEELNGGE